MPLQRSAAVDATTILNLNPAGAGPEPPRNLDAVLVASGGGLAAGWGGWARAWRGVLRAAPLAPPPPPPPPAPPPAPPSRAPPSPTPAPSPTPPSPTPAPEPPPPLPSPAPPPVWLVSASPAASPAAGEAPLPGKPPGVGGPGLAHRGADALLGSGAWEAALAGGRSVPGWSLRSLSSGAGSVGCGVGCSPPLSAGLTSAAAGLGCCCCGGLADGTWDESHPEQVCSCVRTRVWTSVAVSRFPKSPWRAVPLEEGSVCG